ncbi:MAG: hypothetical protein FWC79_05530 [Oscillospiraceae bacterium]|nr:hypothetical protein [Oscillospiraceae bacterium]
MLARIKEFIKNKFNINRKLLEDGSINNKVDADSTKKLKFDVAIKNEDKETIRILELQQRFSNGFIEEDDISEEDHDKLNELYDKQIIEIKGRIEKQRQEFLEIIRKSS